MTELSEPPPLPSLPKPSVVNTIVCWIVILASIGYVAGRVYLQKSPRNLEGSQQATNDLDLELSARILVGQKMMAVDLGQPATAARDTLPTIDAKAHTPRDRLRVAIVAGEVAGGSEAIRRMKQIDVGATTQPIIDDLATLQTIYRGNMDKLDDDERQALIDHHGWFGKLALVFDKGAADPQRARVVSPARRAAWTATAAVLGVGALVGTGAILLILAIVFFSRGTIGRNYAPIAAPIGRPAFLEAFAIYISLFVLFGDVLHRITDTPPLILYLLTTALLPIALMWPARRGLSWRESRLGFGWHRGAGVFTEIGCGLIGYVTGLPIVAAAFVITFFVSRYASASPSHPIMNELRGGAARIGAIYFLACVWAPIMEETMFRGALFNHLRGRWNWIVSALVVGLLFALVHPQGWTAIPVLGSIGAVLACVREWRGSLIGPMFAHALNNATAITIVLLLIGGGSPQTPPAIAG